MLFKVISSALSTVRRVPTVIRNISTYPMKAESEEQMTITDDGQVIVCWHPEKTFPYECSKPLPPPDPPSKSILKMESKEEVYKAFSNKKPEAVVEELMKITYTAKYRWYPRPKRIRAKKTPMDRPYL